MEFINKGNLFTIFKYKLLFATLLSKESQLKLFESLK